MFTGKETKNREMIPHVNLPSLPGIKLSVITDGSQMCMLKLMRKV